MGKPCFSRASSRRFCADRASAKGKRIRAKLSSEAGDTLAEVLVALLVSVMAVTLMATMIMTATNVTSKNETRMAQLYAAQSALASKAAETKQSNGMAATISGPASYTSGPLKIDVYRSNGLLCYEAYVTPESGSS